MREAIIDEDTMEHSSKIFEMDIHEIYDQSLLWNFLIEICRELVMAEPAAQPRPRDK